MQEAKRDRGRAREVNAVLGRGRVRLSEPWEKGASARTGRSGDLCSRRNRETRMDGEDDGLFFEST